MKKNRIILAGLLASASFSQAQTVTLDHFFNHEIHKNAAGQLEAFHYLWEEKDLNGFSNWGDAFVMAGAKIRTLEMAPTTTNLKGTAIYIIVDPDTKKENPEPNYILSKDVIAIAAFVKTGGVLVMLANDSANVELPHFNQLAGRFGMHFNNELHNHVIGEQFEMGAVMVTGNPLFNTAKKIYMKDVCGIDLNGPAKPLLKSDGVAIIATGHYGKGTVLAIADPWLYNEYTNGRLPAGYDNDKAISDVTEWLLKQVPPKK